MKNSLKRTQGALGGFIQSTVSNVEHDAVKVFFCIQYFDLIYRNLQSG